MERNPCGPQVFRRPMPLAPIGRLRSCPVSVCFPLQLILRAGVRSDDILPLLAMAESEPASLRVGLFEHLRPMDRALLGAVLLQAVSLPPMFALHLQPLTLFMACGLVVLLSAAFFHASVWRLREVLTHRAREFARGRMARPQTQTFPLLTAGVHPTACLSALDAPGTSR